MHRVSMLFTLGLAIAVPASLAASQDQHGSHAAAVMGFDQNATTHHFFLFGDGGAIDVGVKDPGDAANRSAIQSHLPHIAVMFGEGNFDAPMLVHDSANVPGTQVMAARKDTLRYRYVETASGGRVEIFTTDRAALDAVHAFLAFQITEHNTGDTTTVRAR